MYCWTADTAELHLACSQLLVIFWVRSMAKPRKNDIHCVRSARTSLKKLGQVCRFTLESVSHTKLITDLIVLSGQPNRCNPGHLVEVNRAMGLRSYASSIASVCRSPLPTAQPSSIEGNASGRSVTSPVPRPSRRAKWCAARTLVNICFGA